MVSDFLKKLYGNVIVFTHVPGQRRVPYLSEEELWARCNARLRKIVRYAAATVPYYQDLFRREKIDPRTIRSVEDLDRLPLLSKDMVRKHPRLFVSTSRQGRMAIPFLTSGSTGTPLQVDHDAYSLLANIAFGERERAVVARFCGREVGYREIYINYSAATIRKVWDFYRHRTFIPMRPERQTLSVLDPIADVINAINHFRPDAIVSYGSYLEILFKTLKLRDLRMHLPQVLIYVSDAMTSAGSRFIEEHFGVPVLSRYNAVEAFKIGFFCEERRGFHLHADLCHVKIINAQGERVKRGTKGEVVISNLINRGTVLLNYRLGDVAALASEKCSCGRIFPVLSELEGRVEDTIFLRNGEVVHPRAIWGVFKPRTEVLKYQLIQHTSEHFELKLVTVDRTTYQRLIDEILADLRDLLGEVAIESAFYGELETPITGKFRPVISLCK